jgi:type I restriction enzyme M protein
VPKADIAANDYDLTINRYKEVVYEEVEYDAPSDILKRIESLDLSIAKGVKELGGLLK